MVKEEEAAAKPGEELAHSIEVRDARIAELSKALADSEERRMAEVTAAEEAHKADLAAASKSHVDELDCVRREHAEVVAQLEDFRKRMSSQVCLLKEAAKQIDGEPIALPLP